MVVSRDPKLFCIIHQIQTLPFFFEHPLQTVTTAASTALLWSFHVHVVLDSRVYQLLPGIALIRLHKHSTSEVNQALPQQRQAHRKLTLSLIPTLPQLHNYPLSTPSPFHSTRTPAHTLTWRSSSSNTSPSRRRTRLQFALATPSILDGHHRHAADPATMSMLFALTYLH
jgi:hypothetical protein